MKKRTINTLLIFFILGFSSSVTGQIVNVESLRKQTDTTGIAGGIGLNGTYLDNKKVIYTLGLTPHIQYKWEKDLFLMVLDYKLTKSQNVSFEDASFYHTRYSHEYTDLLRWESFIQIQENKVTKLKYRYLVGSGIRLKVIDLDNIRLYLATTPMYEQERIMNESRTINKVFRLSNYISLSFFISETAELFSTSYYQPVIGEIRDYRFYNEQILKVKLWKNLKFSLSTLYTWDNFPPDGAPARTFQTKTGLQYNF